MNGIHEYKLGFLYTLSFHFEIVEHYSLPTEIFMCPKCGYHRNPGAELEAHCSAITEYLHSQVMRRRRPGEGVTAVHCIRPLSKDASHPQVCACPGMRPHSLLRLFLCLSIIWHVLPRPIKTFCFCMSKQLYYHKTYIPSPQFWFRACAINESLKGHLSLVLNILKKTLWEDGRIQ